jgi:hypothetical protein
VPFIVMTSSDAALGCTTRSVGRPVPGFQPSTEFACPAARTGSPEQRALSNIERKIHGLGGTLMMPPEELPADLGSRGEGYIDISRYKH